MRDVNRAGLAVGAIALVTVAYGSWLSVSNTTTVALTFLLVVLVAAATSRLWVAVVTSFAAMLCFNFFFLPPVGTLTIADPQNWVALVAFLAVSLVASHFSSVARARTCEAVARRNEVARLFDLSRDVLLTSNSGEAIPQLAQFIARRFDLDYVAVCLPRHGDWAIYRAGSVALPVDKPQLDEAFALAGLPIGDKGPAYSGQQAIWVAGHEVRLVPLRHGRQPIGLLVVAGHTVEPGALDATAGVAAIAIERAQFLEERKAAELARQSEELKSALLASLGHDLRTPLTAIRLAATNLQSSWIDERERQEQSDIVLTEVERLTRLFHNILEMARIDAGAVAPDVRWVDPTDIVDAARSQVEHMLRSHPLEIAVQPHRLVELDPRLTAAALAHLVENAAQYTAPAAPVTIVASVGPGGLELKVRDRGPGIAVQDLPHLFDRFYRGSEAVHRISGTGMGLSIARGLLAAEGGRVFAENRPDGGAEFTIVVPAKTRTVSAAEVQA